MEIDIKLGKYKGLKVKKNKIKVEKQEINKALDYLQNSRAKIITVNRPAQKGDRVEIDFEVRRGGTKVENGESKNHPLILGKGSFMPGFEEKLEGMKAGEKKEVSLGGFNIKVKMNLVQQRELSKVDNEFAKSLGDFNSLDDLKKSIEDGLMREKETKEKERIKMALIEKIVEDSKTNIPENLISAETERMLNEFKNNIANMGLEFEKYLEQIKKTAEELKKDWWKQAEKRIKTALCLQEISERENIEVRDEEVEEKINQELKQYPNVEEVKKNIDLEQLKEYTKNILKNQKTFDLLAKEAEIL